MPDCNLEVTIVCDFKIHVITYINQTRRVCFDVVSTHREYIMLSILPPPYTNEQYFLEKTGHTGLNNIISAYPDKSAYAQCIFAYTAGKGQEVLTFVGRTDGKETALLTADS